MKNFKNVNLFSFQKASNNNVYRLSKNINANKAMGCDLTPPKLVKITADQLAEPITCIINSATSKYLPKEASVTPVDQRVNNKHTFSNYRPVSVLNTSSKII